MKRFVIGLAVVIGLIIVVATVWLFWHDRRAAAPAPLPPRAGLAQAPRNIMLAIPGAKPIDAPVDDFRLSSSPWVVVSKTRPLPDSQYRPDDLVLPTEFATNTQKSDEERSVRQLIVSPLQNMLADARAAGFDLFVASGFRSYNLQNSYYTNYVRTSGETAANQFSARPGYSEHQTGLAVDLSLMSRECYLETCFGETAAGKWLAANAQTYGFILRYPADKTEITGYQYEPWHFRFVSPDLAKALFDSKLTLDQITPQLEKARAELVKRGSIKE